MVAALDARSNEDVVATFLEEVSTTLPAPVAAMPPQRRKGRVPIPQHSVCVAAQGKHCMSNPRCRPKM
jgi:hypothetical protein